MQDTIKALAAARRMLAFEKANWDAVQADIKKAFGDRLKIAEEQMGDAKAKVMSAESAVRVTALNQYAQDGDKHPHPAITIKVYTVVKYEESSAKAFAVQFMQDALKLNRGAFEKGVKALQGMSLGEVTDQLEKIVAIVDDPRATIARDLGGY